MAVHSFFPSSFISLSSYHRPDQPWLLWRPPMAVHSLFPSRFLSLSSCRQPNQPWFQRRPPALTVCRVSTRKSRKLLSDADLCKGLSEFVSSVGLPSSHVPSIKELTEHGRKDLAYIVRRRGYSAIKDLLSKYNDRANGSETEDVRTEENVSLHLQDDTAGVHVEAESLIASGSQDASSFQEKVEKFLNHGELETVEDNIGKDLWVDEAVGNEVYGESSRSAALAINDYAAANATSVFSNSAANLSAEKNQMSGPSSEVPADFNLDEDDIAKSKVRNQVEVDHLTFLLHQKELELSQLKEEIEKEKQALFELQAKAENEINKAQELVLEKDAELLAAEESLTGLKEVEIQYRGEGETVEVSGSFNGWHQRIKLDPLAPSTNSRNPRLWSLTLWLYPGKYEIKFIVDGQWKIDPQRETTKRGGIENNILRVDRSC